MAITRAESAESPPSCIDAHARHASHVPRVATLKPEPAAVRRSAHMGGHSVPSSRPCRLSVRGVCVVSMDVSPPRPAPSGSPLYQAPKDVRGAAAQAATKSRRRECGVPFCIFFVPVSTPSPEAERRTLNPHGARWPRPGTQGPSAKAQGAGGGGTEGRKA